VSNPNLEIKLYGQNHDVLIAGAVTTENNPPTCGLELVLPLVPSRCETRQISSTSPGLARMKWISKMSGYHSDSSDRKTCEWHVAHWRSCG
jgi:hypothetical protein